MKIKPVTIETLNLVNKIESSFIVDSKLNIKLAEGSFSYEIQPVKPYKKIYGYEDIDYSEFIDNHKKIVFLAFDKDELAGQIIVAKNWNSFARIEDIRIEQKHRIKGIGSALMKKAIEWAKLNNFPGMEVETQNVNVKASTFYEKNGFVLGGVSLYAYKAGKEEKDEILLNWYMLF